MRPSDRPARTDSRARDPASSNGLAASLRATLEWIGDQANGFHSALGLFLTLGLLLTIVALLLFVATAAIVAEGLTERVDSAVLLWFNDHATPRLDTAALQLTGLGSVYITVPVVVIASVLLWETRHSYSAALLWVAVSGGWLLSRILKALFDRPRPDLFEWRVPYAGEASYPSGHALSAMVLYATLAYLIVRLESSTLLKGVTLATFIAIIFVVGLSRVYLGVHYPSDVIGGFLVGFCWATTCALGIEAIRFFREKKPEVAEQERDLEQGVLNGGAS